MIVMVRALVAAATVIVLIPLPGVAADQRAVRLTVTVVLIDAAGTATPVPRHGLLVSDSPPSAAPERIVTGPDGTGGLNLRPGRYIVESDDPVVFDGQAYRWIQAVEVVGDRDAVLELTVDNAIVEPLTASEIAAAAAEAEAPADADPSAPLRRWQDSVVAIWTPTGFASGSVIDRRGLIVTSQRLMGDATSVEVQLTPTTKVAGTVFVFDPARDIALVRVHPSTVASIAPIPLDCAVPANPLVDDQEVTTIGIPFRGPRDLEFGTVRRVTSQVVGADFGLRSIRPGGPVFADDGRMVGITSIANAEDEEALRGEVRVVHKNEACAVIRLAEARLQQLEPPDAERLPVEPAAVMPRQALDDAVEAREDNLSAYVMSSSDFDVTFVTPVLLHAALHQANPPTMDFSNWSDYVRDVPPVLLVRVTPKQSESIWMKLFRGAARTQGASLPPITSFRSGFARLRAFCGEREVAPVHPFRLELRVSETEAVYEGLSVFAPDALGPHCGTVRLLLYSEKEPDGADTLEVAPDVLRQIWQDFAPYRELRTGAQRLEPGWIARSMLIRATAGVPRGDSAGAAAGAAASPCLAFRPAPDHRPSAPAPPRRRARRSAATTA
jgi:hypothetical protein